MRRQCWLLLAHQFDRKLRIQQRDKIPTAITMKISVTLPPDNVYIRGHIHQRERASVFYSGPAIYFAQRPPAFYVPAAAPKSAKIPGCSVFTHLGYSGGKKFVEK
jgi:hypothetical protein